MKLLRSALVITCLLPIAACTQKGGVEYDCSALGQRYAKTLDKDTKMGRVAYIERKHTCAAEILNDVAGTHYYTIVAIPSGRLIIGRGAADTFRSPAEDAARLDIEWEQLVKTGTIIREDEAK